MPKDTALDVEDMEERSEERCDVVEERRSEIGEALAPSDPVLMWTKSVGAEMLSPEHGCSSTLFRLRDILRCAEMLVFRLSVGWRGDRDDDDAAVACSSLS